MSNDNKCTKCTLMFQRTTWHWNWIWFTVALLRDEIIQKKSSARCARCFKLQMCWSAGIRHQIGQTFNLCCISVQHFKSTAVLSRVIFSPAWVSFLSSAF